MRNRAVVSPYLSNSGGRHIVIRHISRSDANGTDVIYSEWGVLPIQPVAHSDQGKRPRGSGAGSGNGLRRRAMSCWPQMQQAASRWSSRDGLPSEGKLLRFAQDELCSSGDSRTAFWSKPASRMRSGSRCAVARMTGTACAKTSSTSSPASSAERSPRPTVDPPDESCPADWHGEVIVEVREDRCRDGVVQRRETHLNLLPKEPRSSSRGHRRCRARY